jgi:hypothetical protein
MRPRWGRIISPDWEKILLTGEDIAGKQKTFCRKSSNWSYIQRHRPATLPIWMSLKSRSKPFGEVDEQVHCSSEQTGWTSSSLVTFSSYLHGSKLKYSRVIITSHFQSKLLYKMKIMLLMYLHSTRSTVMTSTASPHRLTFCMGRNGMHRRLSLTRRMRRTRF